MNIRAKQKILLTSCDFEEGSNRLTRRQPSLTSINVHCTPMSLGANCPERTCRVQSPLQLLTQDKLKLRLFG